MVFYINFSYFLGPFVRNYFINQTKSVSISDPESGSSKKSNKAALELKGVIKVEEKY